jgi:hypothetical protein
LAAIARTGKTLIGLGTRPQLSLLQETRGRKIVDQKVKATIRALKTDMVTRSNRHFEAMRGMSGESALTYVRNIIDRNQIVFGVYRDSDEVDGVGMHLIKGARELQAILASGAPQDLRSDAVPCNDLDEAIEAEQTLGDGAQKTN